MDIKQAFDKLTDKHNSLLCDNEKKDKEIAFLRLRVKALVEQLKPNKSK